MKKVISLVLSVMMMLTMFAGCKASGTAETAAPTSSTAAETSADTTPAVQEFNVAIVQQLDHASLDEIRTAIVAQLQALAEEKGVKVNIQEFNGQNDATVLNQIGAQVVGDGVDLIIPIATLAAQCMVTIEGRGGLEYRGNDEEDFVDVSVGSIEAALQMAYELGLKNAKEARHNVA